MLTKENLLEIVLKLNQEKNKLEPEKFGYFEFNSNYGHLKTSLKRLEIPNNIIFPFLFIPEENLFKLLSLEFLILPENKVDPNNFQESFNTNWNLNEFPIIIVTENYSIIIMPYNYKVEIMILDNYKNENDRFYNYNYFFNPICSGNEINLGTVSIFYYNQILEYQQKNKGYKKDKNSLAYYWLNVSEFDRQFCTDYAYLKNQFKINNISDNQLKHEKRILKSALIMSRIIKENKLSIILGDI